MKRRQVLHSAGAIAAMGSLGLIRPAFAAAPTMTTVAKIIGVPYFSLLQTGLVAAGHEFGIASDMIGPAHVDPAQQVRLVEDTIAKRVDVLGLIPLDVKVLAPVVKRARDAGIIVVTQEGPEMEGRNWDVEMVDSTAFGKEMMKSLARQMDEKGDYICIVGTLTTPLHNLWCDAAIAYQKKTYPNMRLAADRFPGADEIDTTEQVVRTALQAYPDLRGVIGFGSSGPIGAGNVVRQRRLQAKLSVTGFALPSQAKPLIDSGALKEVFLWNPREVGEALVAVASLVLKNTEFRTGMDIPGIGKAMVDPDKKIISVSRMLTLNKQTLPDLLKLGI
ncbi:MAG: substrate-binding domain-containing protein [Janthinobacterium lividum]